MNWKDELKDLKGLPDHKEIERMLKKMVKAGILLKVKGDPSTGEMYQPNKHFVRDVDQVTDENWKEVWEKWNLEKTFRTEIWSDYKKLKKKYKGLKIDELKKNMLYDLMTFRKEQKKDLSYIG